MLKKLRNTLGPLLIMLTCPPFAILFWYTNTTLQGSFQALFDLFYRDGLFTSIYYIWRPVFFGSTTAWFMIAIFSLFQFLLMKFLPGKPFYGPITPMGNVPVYKANGVAAFVTTLATFTFTSFYLHLFSATIIYDNLGYLLGALNLLSVIVCLLLYVKGQYFPSSSDSGITHHFLFDYYWGTELYPQVFGISIKKFITCRLGMMSWGLILLSYAAKQHELYGLSNSLLISVALQLIYVSKFFIWETGYLRSLDIMHDRAGFYICWGCLVWVPCVYTSPSMYLVLHPIHLNTWLAVSIFMLGAISIFINYSADRQRQLVRATNGNCKIWGKKPVVTLATYKTERNEIKQNIILASGWWGISRHFHYVPEILAAFFWSVPALFTNFAPYFYVSFLSILLLDRAFRDDKRCAQKYADDWQTYCKLVPYKILPYLI